jgi:hypothetical protein
MAPIDQPRQRRWPYDEVRIRAAEAVHDAFLEVGNLSALGRLLGVSGNIVGKWERGERVPGDKLYRAWVKGPIKAAPIAGEIIRRMYPDAGCLPDTDVQEPKSWA